MRRRVFDGIVRKACGAAVLLSLTVFMGCGGGSSSSSSGTNNPLPNPGNGALTTPTELNLSGGQAATGVNIVVPAAAASPAPNAINLGVTTGTQGSADNTGATVPLGFVGTALLFGQGLSANMQISISGPQDIVITNAQSITATDGTPGVAFNIAVSPTAALGARTVVLQNPQNDVTTFTGGLEVTQ